MSEQSTVGGRERRRPSCYVAAFTFSLAALAGCAATRAPRTKIVATPAPSSPEAGMSAQAMGGMCPTHVPGTSVTVEDTKDGVTLAFTTRSDVAELRRRVRRVAEMHMGAQAGGRAHRMKIGAMIPSKADVEDTDGGARIVLTPHDRSQLDALRRQARAHAYRMSQGDCAEMAM